MLFLTLSWRRPLSYRNQSIDLLSKSDLTFSLWWISKFFINTDATKTVTQFYTVVGVFPGGNCSCREPVTWLKEDYSAGIFLNVFFKILFSVFFFFFSEHLQTTASEDDKLSNSDFYNNNKDSRKYLICSIETRKLY